MPDANGRANADWRVVRADATLSIVPATEGAGDAQ